MTHDYTGHCEVRVMTSWGATKAKAQFSEVLDKAHAEGPQLVTRRKEEFLLVTREQWNEHAGRGSAEVPQGKKQSLWEALRLPPEDRVDGELFPRLRSKAKWAKF